MLDCAVFIVGHLASIFLYSYSSDVFTYLVPMLAGIATWGTNFFYFILATSYLVPQSASSVDTEREPRAFFVLHRHGMN